MEKENKISKKSQKLAFFWIFNPDGSVTDYSTEDYSSWLNNLYIPSTSSEAYLGAY